MKYWLLAVASITLLVSPFVNAGDGGGEVLGFAHITNTPYSGIVNTQINFTGGTTGGTPPFTYAWDFDYNGTFNADATSQNANHTYTTVGTYVVAFNVTDATGNYSIDTTTCVVYSVSNNPPFADFVFRPRHPAAGELVRFYDLSADTDGAIVSWSWSFGDGDTDNIRNPDNRFMQAGTYVVKLIVTDDDGASTTHSEMIRVYTESLGEDNNNYTVALYFIDVHCKPQYISHMDVTVYQDGEIIYQGVTDENGSVKFGCVGDITVTATKPGFQKYSIGLTVYKDMPVVIEIREQGSYMWLWWIPFVFGIVSGGLLIYKKKKS